MVIGIKDAAISERLQMDADLTLDQAMKAVRQMKVICEQQPVLHKAEASSERPDKLDSVRTKAKLLQTSRNPTDRKSESKSCSRRGKVTTAVTSTQQKMLCVTNARRRVTLIHNVFLKDQQHSTVSTLFLKFHTFQ